MEKVKKYRSIVRTVIEAIHNRHTDNKGEIRNQLIIDEKNENFLYFMNGWRKSTRYYSCIIHIEVTNKGRVWLHQDRTDFIVADLLLEKGIPKQDIILGFHAPVMRADTEFAVA